MNNKVRRKDGLLHSLRLKDCYPQHQSLRNQLFSDSQTFTLILHSHLGWDLFSRQGLKVRNCKLRSIFANGRQRLELMSVFATQNLEKVIINTRALVIIRLLWTKCADNICGMMPALVTQTLKFRIAL